MNYDYPLKGGSFGGRKSSEIKEKKGKNEFRRHGEGRSHRSFVVWDVGCEGHNTRWTDVRGSLPKKARGQWGLVISSHDMKGGNSKRINDAENGKSSKV